MLFKTGKTIYLSSTKENVEIPFAVSQWFFSNCNFWKKGKYGNQLKSI